MNNIRTNTEYIINIFFATIAIVPLFTSSELMHGSFTAKEILFKVTVCLLIIFYSLNVLISRQINVTLNQLDIFVIAKSAIIILIFFISPKYIIFPGMMLYLSLFYILFLFQFCRNKKYPVESVIIKYCLILLVTCAIQIIIGFAQFLKIIPYKNQIVFDSIVIGTFSNSNHLGAYIAPIIPMFFRMKSLAGSKIWERLISLILFLAVVLLVMTKCRGAWLGAVIGITYYFRHVIISCWKKLKRWKLKLCVIMIALLIFIFLIHVLILMNVSSSHGRVFIWKITMQMIADHFLSGLGYGSYSIYYLDYQALFFEQESTSFYYDYASNIKQAHNSYLQIMAETGIIGMVLWLAIFLSYYYLRRRLLSDNENKHIKDYVNMFAASMIIMLVHSFFDSNLYFLPVILLLYFNMLFISILSGRYITRPKSLKNVFLMPFLPKNL